MYFKLSGGIKMKNALSLGTFDGVHIGHRAVLNMPKNYRGVAVTFEIPPKAVFSGKKELIMTAEDKVSALKNIGIDEVLILDFNAVKDMEPQEFLLDLWVRYHPQLISCGFNYRFGKNAKGDTTMLKQFCDEKGIEFCVCEPIKYDGEIVSSSNIRDLLKKGEIEKANKFLEVPFSFESEVIKGDQRGRTIGFPTVNQKYPNELVELKFGVYKTRVIFDGNIYMGMTDIGIRPTFESDFVISETYIKDYSGDLYGKKIRIEPVEFIREEKKFSGLEELKKQISEDLRRL